MTFQSKWIIIEKKKSDVTTLKLKELVQMKTCRRKWLARWLAACIAVVLGMGMCAGLPVSAAYENTYTNTGNQRADIVAVAKTQIGYHEGSLEGTTNSNKQQ